MTAPQRSGPQALLLTGGLGAGKTTVAVAVGEALERAGTAVAVVDLDWLCWAWSPRLSDDGVHDLLCRNLAAIVPNLTGAGVQRLVLARAVVSSRDVAMLRDALAGMPLVVVRLEVPDAEARRRLRARDHGQQLADHLAAVTAFAVRVRDATPGAPAVDATSGDPAAVADGVLRLVGWS